MSKADFTWPLVLIGFMGSGKSTVGALLAARLQLPFVDCDQVLVRDFGCSIAELFANGRTEEFREREARLIQSLCASGQPCVVATGGGACTRAESARRLREEASTLWLDVPWPILQARLGNDPQRPLLARQPEALYAQRLPVYRGCARWRIDAADSAEKTADAILQSCGLLPT